MSGPAHDLAHAPPRRGGFGRTLIVVLGILVLLVAGLTAANAVRGPRLVGAQLNAQALVERDGARLLLDADQRLRPVTADDVSISPTAPVEASSDGREITLEFGDLLSYDTDYEIRVAGATGSDTGATATLTYAFSTPDPPITSLVRGGGPLGPSAGDVLVRRALSGGAQTVIAGGGATPAGAIQEWAELPGWVAVVSVTNAAGGGALSLVSTVPRTGADAGTASAAVTPPIVVATPPGASIEKLDASPTAGLFGFVVTTASGDPDPLDSVLFVRDPSDQASPARAVSGLDGQPLSVLDWSFVPGTGSIVAQAFDQSLFLIDTLTDDPPVPLGAHAELRGFVPGTQRLIVADPTQGSTIDLSTSDTRVLMLPSDEQPADSIATETRVLSDDSYVELLSEPSTAAGADAFERESRVLAVDADGARELYRPAADGTRIRDVCLSPNRRMLAVEVVSSDATFDAYPNVPSFTGITTVFVNVATGEQTGGIPGFQTSWCR